MLQAIVFDKDGVIVDFEKTWGRILGAMARELGRGDAALVSQLEDVAGIDRNNGGFKAGSVWAAGNAEDLLDVWEPLMAGWSRDGLETYLLDICDNASPHPIVPVDVMTSIFEGFRAKGLKLGIVTNDSELSANRNMVHFSLAERFDKILGYDSVENPKPAADPVLAFCHHCAVEPQAVAVVGDNTHDMEMAMAAGAGVRIGVLSGNSTLDELMPVSDFVIDDISHLQHALLERNLLK